MRRLLPLIALAAGPWVRGAEVEVHMPFQTGVSYTLDVVLTNDDNGAVYDSARVEVLAGLAERIFALGNSGEATVEDMMNSGWSLTLRDAPVGEVSFGWSADAQANGSVSLTNNGIVPGGTFTIWRDTSTDSSQDTMALRVGISNDLLELNGNSTYEPFTLSDVSDPAWNPAAYDAIIVRSDSALLGASNHVGASEAGPREGVFVGQEGIFSYSTSGQVYVLLSPWDFAEWTDFGSEHGELEPGGDANGNGVSNYVDYASGQDPEGSGLLAAVDLTGTTLTLRRRVNGLDAQAVAEYSDDLEHWHALEEGVHYTVTSNTVTGPMRTLVLELLPGQPPTRFFRQGFGD